MLKDAPATVETIRYIGNQVQETINRFKNGEYHIWNAEFNALVERLSRFKYELDNPLYDQTGGANEEVKAFLKELLNEVHAQVSRENERVP